MHNIAKGGYVISPPLLVKKEKRIDYIADKESNDYRKLIYVLTRKYTDTLQISSTVPSPLENKYYTRLDNFAVSLSKQMGDTCDEATVNKLQPLQVTQSVASVFQQNINRLSGILGSYDNAMQYYTALFEQQSLGYRFFLYVSDITDTTCETCFSKNGEVYIDESLRDGSIIPPMHPNCRCKLVAMDINAYQRYNSDSNAFMNSVREVIDFYGMTSSGLYVLQHRSTLYGIAPDTLAPLKLPQSTAIVSPDTSRSNTEPWYNALSYWASKFGSDAKAVWDNLVAGYVSRAENAFTSIPSFLDYMTFGLVSGYFRGNKERGEIMLVDPSPYNVADWLLSGVPGMASDTFKPEEPLSFSHWMNSLGTATLFYISYRFVRHNMSVRADIKAAEASTNAVAGNSLPEGWTKTENNGFTHIRDAEGNIRVRIDPPDSVTSYTHKHYYDSVGNSLDINGNIVSPKSPDAHIPLN